MWKQVRKWFNYRRKYKEMKALNKAILMENHAVNLAGEAFFEKSQDTSFTARCMLGAVAMQNGGEIYIPPDMYKLFIDGSIDVSVTNTEDGTICIRVSDNDEKSKQNSFN